MSLYTEMVESGQAAAHEAVTVERAVLVPAFGRLACPRGYFRSAVVLSLITPETLERAS